MSLSQSMRVRPANYAMRGSDHRRLVGRVLQRQRREHVEKLFTAIEELGADAEAKGPTDEIVDEELAAYNGERRR